MKEYKLIVNSPSGEQQEIKVSKTGGYFDDSLIVYDERTDGKLPDNYELGKLIKIDGVLSVSPDFLPEHQALIDQKAAEAASNAARDVVKNNYVGLRESMLADAEVVNIIEFAKNNNKQAIIDHFQTKKPLELNESIAKIAIILATMNEDITNE